MKYGSNEFIKDTLIKTLLDGLLKKIGILTSEITMTKDCRGVVNIQFLYYPLIAASAGSTQTGGPNSNLIIPALNLIKKILVIKNPHLEYKLVCVKANNKFSDSKILNDYITNMATADPSKLKNIVGSIVKEYKILYTKLS